MNFTWIKELSMISPEFGEEYLFRKILNQIFSA